MPSFLLVSGSLSSQKLGKQQTEDLSREHFTKGVAKLRKLLSVPINACYPEHVTVNVAWCEQAFEKRDFQIKFLPTVGSHLTLASRMVSQELPTVLIYP